jgi:hypothetical protein
LPPKVHFAIADFLLLLKSLLLLILPLELNKLLKPLKIRLKQLILELLKPESVKLIIAPFIILAFKALLLYY